jgi:hypothetical protein
VYRIIFEQGSRKFRKPKAQLAKKFAEAMLESKCRNSSEAVSQSQKSIFFMKIVASQSKKKKLMKSRDL